MWEIVFIPFLIYEQQQQEKQPESSCYYTPQLFVVILKYKYIKFVIFTLELFLFLHFE